MGLSDLQKKRQRKIRQVHRFRDEACRKLLEKDEELEASRAENNEIREICREKIEQHQAVVKKVKETCEHQPLDITRLREHNSSLKFQLEELSTKTSAVFDETQVTRVAQRCFSAGAATVAELRNCYSFLQWASVAGTPDDFKFISPQLRQTSLQILNVPSASLEVQCQCQMAALRASYLAKRYSSIVNTRPPPRDRLVSRVLATTLPAEPRTVTGAAAVPAPVHFPAGDGPPGRSHVADA